MFFVSFFFAKLLWLNNEGLPNLRSVKSGEQICSHTVGHIIPGSQRLFPRHPVIFSENDWI